MKCFYQKIASALLFLLAGTMALAQSFSYKNLSVELQSLQKQLVPDRRVAILDVELKDTLQKQIVLSGETDLPEAKDHIVSFLNAKKVLFVDSFRVLPDPDLLGVKTWALGTLSVLNLRAQPGDATELVSQAVMGTPMKVLDCKNGWYRVQTPDHYIGWTDSGIQLLTATEMNRWKESNRYVFNRMSGYAYVSPDKNSDVVTDLILDNLFEAEAEVRGFLKIMIPDGRIAYVRKTECLSWKEWIGRKPDVQSVITVARKMMGSPYLWGGASSKEADCSGFVKLVYFSQGIILARDASQQVRSGEKIDFSNRENLRPGDLLFFGRSIQRVTHVGIYLENGDFIHSSGRVQISSINPEDPKYNPKRNLVEVRRIIDLQPDTEEIVRVKDHPWYSNL